METAVLVELIKSAWREIIIWRSWLFVLFLIVCFALLGVGITWNERYETSAMLYADTTNIIEPLLRGKAELTDIDRSKEARELLYTRKIMMKVATDVGLTDGSSTLEKEEAVLGFLRSNISIKTEGKDYFRIVYSDENQDSSFRILNAVVDAFIKDSSASRREESRSAFEFIDQQVVTYKRQLLIVERKLKEFRSTNLDGNADSVNMRLAKLREGIEERKLVIEETESKLQSIGMQLDKEGKFIEVSTRVDAQKARLETLRAQLDILRLSYQETYPDIVNLKEQIDAQTLVIEAMQGEGYVSSSSSEGLENPLFEQLRSSKAEEETELISHRRRLGAMERMLEDEYRRAERIAANEAELSELNRDYSVTKDIYEDMLSSKEKARLSMTLDVEGQGVSFKIQEPAVFPLTPSGLRFLHFAIIAPFAGLIISLGMIVLYVLLDARARSPIMLMASLPDNIDLLANIPHVNTPLSERLLRSDMIMLGLILLASLVLYGALVYSRLRGLI